MNRLLLAALALSACAALVAGACQGNACREQHEAAQAAGLLGGTAQQLGSCTPKTYPTQGTIGVVGGSERSGRCQRCRCRTSRRVGKSVQCGSSIEHPAPQLAIV